MPTMKIVLTSDKRNWLLPGFLRQWGKYSYEKDITIVGFTKPEFQLPDFANFYSIGNFSDYPASKWSNAIIKALKDLGAERYMIMLEDYWLTRNVAPYTYQIAEEIMKNDILRFDLTSDRLYCGSTKNIGSVGHVDIIEGTTENYHVSMQAGVWDAQKLLSILEPDESPWEFEIKGSARAFYFGTDGTKQSKVMRVFGQRQWLMQYQIMVRNGELVFGGDWMFPPRSISEKDLSELRDGGCLNENR